MNTESQGQGSRLWIPQGGGPSQVPEEGVIVGTQCPEQGHLSLRAGRKQASLPGAVQGLGAVPPAENGSARVR